MKPASLSEFTFDQIQSYYFNLNQINIVLRRKIKNTLQKDMKSTQRTTKSQKQTKEDREYMKITYLTKREKEKTI